MKISKLVIYPVKGCRGIEVDAAQITPEGLATSDGMLRDRMFMIVDANGKFISQRQHSELATIVTRIEANENAASRLSGSQTLLLVAPSMTPLRVSLRPASDRQAPSVDVKVWSWQGKALDEGERAAEWLTSLLGRPARLVRHDGFTGEGSFVRLVDTSWGAEQGTRTAFADGYPYLLASERSLQDLNECMKTNVPMDRFRPNIVVEGASKPWDEDYWDQVAIDKKVVLKVVKPCDRCKVPTIDQALGIVSPNGEPLKTLRELRSGLTLKWTDPPHSLPKSVMHAVFFACNCCSVHGNGSIVAVGDDIEVTSRRASVPRPLVA